MKSGKLIFLPAAGIALLGALTVWTAVASAATAPTTEPATAITSSDATLNGTNGGTAATDSSFWVSTSTFSTASSTLPSGVYSTADLGAQGANAAFSASLSSASGLPAVTPDTTYYYAAWTSTDGGATWTPGAVMNFTTLSAPTITGVSPASGSTAGGTSITITGADFHNGATVTVGGAAATGVSVASSTSITATTPAGTTGAQDVVVTNPDGGTVTSTGAFTYTAASSSAPTITSIAPTNGSTAGGTSVVITGTGFTGATAVDFGTTPAAITATTSDSSLTVTAPAASSTGPVDVTVTTPSGTSATSSADQFTYNAPATSTAPVISDIAVSDIGTSSAMVTWNTDQASFDDIAYGTSTNYGMTTSIETSASTTHSATLSNLDEATLYHFQISAGNGTATSTSADQEFDTASTASTTPLAIDSITTDQSSGVADNTYADGWQWTIHFTVPTNEDAFRIRFSDWGNASSSFPTANDVQIYSPESSNATSSSSAIGETDNGYSDWIYLNGDTDPLTPGRQVDLVVQVKIPFGTPNGSYSSNFTAETYPSTATSTAQ